MSTATNEGKIVQCIGAVIDVEFPRNAMPKVYDALVMDGSELTLEVQQQRVTVWFVPSVWVHQTACAVA